MFADTITKLADSGAAKARAIQNNPLGFLIGAVLAGIYVGFGILLIFSLGSLVDPSVRPLVMGASFGLALILVIFAGSELYTGLTMSMTLAALERRAGASSVLQVLGTAWIGNLVGALALSALFVAGGGGLITGAESGFIYKVAAAKMNAGAFELICRGMLCNWLVCLAIWMANRLVSETAKMIAIAWCLFAFVGSGYEHSIANMTIFGVALLSAHPEGVTWAGAGWNLLWVTIGNTISGVVFMAVLPWLASIEWLGTSRNARDVRRAAPADDSAALVISDASGS